MKLSDLIKKLQALQALDAGYDPTVYGMLDNRAGRPIDCPDEEEPCTVDEVIDHESGNVVIKFSRYS